MNIILSAVQILSALLTIMSAIGLWKNIDILTAYGIDTFKLTIICVVSVLAAIFSTAKKKAIKQNTTIKKQFQFCGKGNNQNMS